MFCSFLLKDKHFVKHISFFSSFNYWKTSPVLYKKLVLGLLIFTLFNSSDVFLLLKIKQTGLNDRDVIIFAFSVGIWADKIGLKKVFITGLLIFVIVYFNMATVINKYLFYGLFLLYGLCAAATEGISKAWISNITEKKTLQRPLVHFRFSKYFHTALKQYQEYNLSQNELLRVYRTYLKIQEKGNEENKEYWGRRLG